jgi:two-component system nitrogen regulation sensor histidine kinase NtrY
LRRIVDEFSSFARMPKPVFRRERVDDIARHALFLHEVAHPDIRFEYRSADGDIELVCDRRQLGQALTNIVKNAVEAIEPKAATDDNHLRGHVRMTVQQDDAHLLIEVQDDGIGLPPERERILEPYMTTRTKGTGLGLAIVKKIVEEHMGEIRFDDAAGGGARVTLRFPIAALEKLEEGQVIALPHGKTTGKVTANGA